MPNSGPRHSRAHQFRQRALPRSIQRALSRTVPLSLQRNLPGVLRPPLIRDGIGGAAAPPLLRGAALVTAFALATFGVSASLSTGARPAGVVAAEAAATATAEPGAGRSAPGAASRGRERAQSAPTPAATTAVPAPAAARRADPVGGLSRAEMNNAIAIVDVAVRERLPKRAAVVALATALQESHLRNLANANLPDSLNHPNEGVGYDYDSVGLFQQRPNWGSVKQLMDPHESARRFYAALLSIPGWGDYAVTVAAQMVQRSAFPYAYAKWEGLANQIADATM
ncbi:hypothetical protein [Dactylosporangium sp. CA-233914]|uniref:hypothetical protein n=1 Tax=Dactylosporangium sp. CA-233914 TaxID=3239934 RepID=UPI003D8AA2CA